MSRGERERQKVWSAVLDGALAETIQLVPNMVVSQKGKPDLDEMLRGSLLLTSLFFLKLEQLGVDRAAIRAWLKSNKKVNTRERT